MAAKKYLGKLYIDRYEGVPLDQEVIKKAVSIIKNQAPSKGKVKIRWSTIRAMTLDTGKYIPACLVATNIKTGATIAKTPLVDILSVGRIGQIAYYINEGQKQKTSDDARQQQRYWVRAFDCRDADSARQTIKGMMEVVKKVVHPHSAIKRGTQLSLLSATSSRGSTVSGISAGSVVPNQTLQTQGSVPNRNEIQQNHKMRHAPQVSSQAPQPKTGRPATTRRALGPINSAFDEPNSPMIKQTGSTDLQKPEMRALHLGNLDDYIQVIDV